MLFMTIFYYEPDKRDEVIARALEQGTRTPDGMKELGVWSDTSGGRVFRLVEADDAEVAYRATYAWSDLGIVETVPVLETDKVLEMLARL